MNMMSKPPRIIAGRFRRRAVGTLAGLHTRPTSDRAREALFSTLEAKWAGHWHGRPCADLCAGFGTLGLEALSRGAASCLFVEADAGAVRCLRQTMAAFGLDREAMIHQGDVCDALPPQAESMGLVLADPPYGFAGTGAMLEGIRAAGWLDQMSLLVLQDDPQRAPAPLPGWLTLRDTRLWGRARFRLAALTG